MQWTINDWNNLPQEVIESENVGTFKSKLDIYTGSNTDFHMYVYINCLRFGFIRRLSYYFNQI